ncbi:MAG: hypothetical protein V4510_13170 [bacterium]
MARKHDDLDPPPVLDPVPETYEDAVARVAAATKVLTDVGLGGSHAAEIALKLYFRCCCGGE